MYLKDLADIIYTPDTGSADVPITVKTFGEVEKVLWRGKAEDLQYWYNIEGWIVVEVLIDKTIPGEGHLPDYNKGKIITVI